jgi:hypothetical protein
MSAFRIKTYDSSKCPETPTFTVQERETGIELRWISAKLNTTGFFRRDSELLEERSGLIERDNGHVNLISQLGGRPKVEY